MTRILPLHPDLEIYLDKHQIRRKFNKQIHFIRTNPKHPSLNLELLEPADKGLYSFRIDLKYRAIFIYRSDLKAIEILTITSHYR
jgi:Txe/YoeB family toxin of Txe-Axe toxin-antitoxin module